MFENQAHERVRRGITPPGGWLGRCRHPEDARSTAINLPFQWEECSHCGVVLKAWIQEPPNVPYYQAKKKPCSPRLIPPAFMM
jgi:hypothetical protein